MSKRTIDNVKLGLFITIGTIILVAALYLIGSKRNIFSNTIKISASFINVNGLMPGNNVRYAGIDIGTVEKIVIENDSSVTVYMIIENKNKKFIKKNAVAAIGTDGLMGNKLVNINPVTDPAPPIEEGDNLISLKPVENDEMLRTLNTTNENLEAITGDLRKFTSRLNKDKGIFRLIEDSISVENIRLALESFRQTADNANALTKQLSEVAKDLNNGQGLSGVLLKDSVVANQLRSTIKNLSYISDSINLVVNDIKAFSKDLNNPGGLAHTVTSDTALTNNIKDGIKNLKTGTDLLNENLKAMRKNWLFRKYFKEEEKKSPK